MSDWYEDEFSTLNLQDQRLNRRAVKVLKAMSERPEGTIPPTFTLAAEVKAAYNLLDTRLHVADAGEAEPQSEGIDRALMSACTDACLKRVGEEQIILAIQDTTEISFASSPVGVSGGLWVHSTFASTLDGVPLGFLDQRCWQRDPDGGQRGLRRERALPDKESYRWLQALRAVHERVPAQTTVITVADREADIYEVFAEPRPENSELVIRACRDRRVTDEHKYLWASVQAAPLAAQISLTLRRRPDRGPRLAVLDLRYKKITLRPPRHGVHEQMPDITLWAVLAHEPHAPSGEEAISWLLLTTLPVSNATEARQCMECYTRRWLIERLHFVLKSGCKVEASQLRTIDRLRALLSLYCVVAWRLLWITYYAREGGDQPATVAFLNLEWRAAFCALHPGQAPPQDTPTLREAVRWVAMLGGFLARKGDGEPGVKVLWRGLDRLHDIIIGVLIYAPHLLDVGNA